MPVRHIVTPNYCKRFNSRRRRVEDAPDPWLITDSLRGVLYPITVVRSWKHQTPREFRRRT